jgi:hypothetical protein
LGFLLIVPEGRIGGYLFEFADAGGFAIDVKDTP